MTVSWGDAHRLAAVATSRLLRDLSLNPASRIPIFELPERLGVVLRAGPLPRLAGAYVAEAGALPGILVNNRHPAARQRYTVAHEIGHHVLGHATSLDADTDFDQTVGGVPDQERMAEAFAAWLLMPRHLVLAELGRLDGNPTTAAGAYQLSLAMGASYAATVRQLFNLRVIDREAMLTLLRVVPAGIKQSAMGEPSVGVGAADVHVINPLLEVDAVVSAGDLVVLNMRGAVRAVESGGRIETVDVVARDGGSRVRLRVLPMAAANPSAGRSVQQVVLLGEDDATTVVTITIEPPREGVPEVWF